MPGGRPTDYSDEIALDLCRRLAEGESLRTVCSSEEMPCVSTVYNWIQSHPEFLEQYTRAKDDSADTYAEKISEIGDKVLAGEYDPNAARVALDAFKWTASKLKPKRYGDKIDHNHTGNIFVVPDR